VFPLHTFFLLLHVSHRTILRNSYCKIQFFDQFAAKHLSSKYLSLIKPSLFCRRDLTQKEENEEDFFDSALEMAENGEIRRNANDEMLKLAEELSQHIEKTASLLKELRDNLEKLSAEEELTIKAARREVQRAAASILAAIPARHRARTRPSTGQREPQPELPFLYGRCFNMSLNIKILSGCHGLDATLASRILADLSALDVGLRARMEPELGGMMNQLALASAPPAPPKLRGQRPRLRIGF